MELEKRLLAPANQFLLDPEVSKIGMALFREAAAELKAQRDQIDSWKRNAYDWEETAQNLLRRAEKAEADRDHWEEQAEKNHSQTLGARRETDRLQEALRHNAIQTSEQTNDLAIENDRLRGLALQAEDLIERASQQWPAEDERWPVFREWKAALGEQE